MKPLLAALLLLLAACAGSEPPKPRLSPAADGRQSTFSIQAVRTTGHRPDLEERCDAALRRALEAKGYRYRDDGGELQVLYALGLDSQTGIVQRPLATQAGVVSQAQIVDSNSARLVMRIVDERSQAVLYEVQLNRPVRSAEPDQGSFDRAIADLLADFPAHRGTP